MMKIKREDLPPSLSPTPSLCLSYDEQSDDDESLPAIEIVSTPYTLPPSIVSSLMDDDEDEAEHTPPPEQTPTTLQAAVVGVYARGKVPREDTIPKGSSLSKMQRDQVMVRKRVGSDSDGIVFSPQYGHAESKYYHADHHEHGKDRVLDERAILLQTMEHYEALRTHPDMEKYFTDCSSDSVDRDHVLDEPSFGEQVIIDGCTASNVCIGDIFEVEGNKSTLKLEVSSPRLCCAYVDKKNGSPFGMKGVRRHCNTHGLGGIFARILVEGELREGMKLVRTSSPHPKFTLEDVAKSLYGEAPRDYILKNWPHWMRSKEELEELCTLEPLGHYEWKEKAEYILEHWSWYENHRSANKCGEKEGQSTSNDCAKDEYIEEEWLWGGSALAPGITFMRPLLRDIMPPVYRMLDVACSGCCAAMGDYNGD